MDELLEILNEVKPGVDFENDTDDIEITPVDIVPENFKTVQTIYDMIQRLSDD